jgi:hypothetical protein
MASSKASRLGEEYVVSHQPALVSFPRTDMRILTVIAQGLEVSGHIGFAP